jgi:hypothetical protein
MSCSLIGAERLPSTWEASQPPNCRQSDLGVLADSAMALAGLALAALALGVAVRSPGCSFAGDERKPNQSSCEIVVPAIIGGVVAGGAFGYSAWRGTQRAEDCKQARDAHQKWVEGEWLRTQARPTAAPVPPGDAAEPRGATRRRDRR